MIQAFKIYYIAGELLLLLGLCTPGFEINNRKTRPVIVSIFVLILIPLWPYIMLRRVKP